MSLIGIVFWLGALVLYGAAFLFAAYWVERRAVRDGILDAGKAKRR